MNSSSLNREDIERLYSNLESYNYNRLVVLPTEVDFGLPQEDIALLDSSNAYDFMSTTSEIKNYPSYA